MPEALTFNEVAETHPDCEIVRVCHYQAGIEACLMVPRAKIAQAQHPPFWRHGDTMHIRTTNQ